MKKVLIIVGAILALSVYLTVAAGGGDSTDTTPAGSAVSQAEVARIQRMTDCDLLQGVFDAAETAGDHYREQGRLDKARAETHYMGVADERMEAVGCYE